MQLVCSTGTNTCKSLAKKGTQCYSKTSKKKENLCNDRNQSESEAKSEGGDK